MKKYHTPFGEVYEFVPPPCPKCGSNIGYLFGLTIVCLNCKAVFSSMEYRGPVEDAA